MSPIGASFDIIAQALTSLYQGAGQATLHLDRHERTLLLSLPTDVAAFSLLDGSVEADFDAAYTEFRRLYRHHHAAWDSLTLSFVACRRSTGHDDDRFLAAIEHDPLFCRKYVIGAADTVDLQREQLLRLPFLPLPRDGQGGLQRPQSAQDLLQSAGLPRTLARKLVESGHRSADRIVADLKDGTESFPHRLERGASHLLSLATPRARSRLSSLSVDGFRAYRGAQSFDLDASVVVLHGPNGLGKTSFFDAIDFACTGRIGRLCRESQRSQGDFARMATHLDRTPGTGSVNLSGRSLGASADSDTWTLKRGTGDWNRAWIGTKEYDRKAVLGFLTHADWLESAPRQNLFESLFRATHLFGQDEQELLLQFKKGSIIPEQFISEMLALQDYSQGLEKAKDVGALLSTQLTRASEELRHLESQVADVTKAIAAAESVGVDVGSTASNDSLVDSLRRKLADDSALAGFIPAGATLQVLEQAAETLAAQMAALQRRVQDAASLLDRFPTYRLLVDGIRVSEASLASLDSQSQQLARDAQDCAARVAAHPEARAAQLAQQRDTQRVISELRDANTALAQRKELISQKDPLQVEFRAQALEAAQLEATAGASEAALSAALHANAATEQDRSRAQAISQDLARLLKDFPAFERDLALSVSYAADLTAAESAAQEATKLFERASADTSVLSAQVVTLAPQYERAVATQAELERLLDSLQPHVHDANCPLCGSSFESTAALLQRIQHIRRGSAGRDSITLRYKTGVAEEASAKARQASCLAQLSSCRAKLDALRKQAAECALRLDAFRKRVRSAAGEGITAITHDQLSLLHEQSAKRLSALDERALAASQALHERQAADTALKERRLSVGQRSTQLAKSIEAIDDHVTQITLSLNVILQRNGTSETAIGDSLAAQDAKLKALSAAIIQLDDAHVRESADLAALRLRQKEAAAQRSTALMELDRQRKALADFVRLFQSLGLDSDATETGLTEISGRAQERLVVLQDILNEMRIVVDALHAQERRLQLGVKRSELDKLKAVIAGLYAERAAAERNRAACASVERMLKGERQASVEKHITSYGPLITNIQQRLRSVYGFGEVQLKAMGSEAAVQVEWVNKNLQVPPTDFFSDSQKQILMLSIFLAGGLRQNWSGFSPVLLDDPVTHFDDLNAYGFVELVRGIVSSHPHGWQFFISTCEERLFSLMRKKFERVEGGAKFYEFMGMSDTGPIIEQRS